MTNFIATLATIARQHNLELHSAHWRSATHHWNDLELHQALGESETNPPIHFSNPIVLAPPPRSECSIGQMASRPPNKASRRQSTRTHSQVPASDSSGGEGPSLRRQLTRSTGATNAAPDPHTPARRNRHLINSATNVDPESVPRFRKVTNKACNNADLSAVFTCHTSSELRSTHQIRPSLTCRTSPRRPLIDAGAEKSSC